MRGLIFSTLVVLAGCSEPTAPLCGREDVTQPCGTSSAVLNGNQWDVTVFIQTSRRIEYNDRGHVCEYTFTDCREVHCTESGTLTASAAINRCRSSQG